MIKYIGIDIGGTNIRVGGIDENNDIIFLSKEKTLENVSNSEDLYNKTNVPDYYNCEKIGIGVPGAIDENTEKILTGRNLEYLIGYPLKERLEEDLGIKVFIENDAKVAALGEALIGAGKDENIVCYITISTGLGGGVVVNKEIYHGANNLGGYFSRMILDGEKISEYIISGTAIINKAKELIDSNIDNTKDVFDLASNGNVNAQKIIEDFKKYLTVLLLNVSVTINPDIIVIGGGVMKSKEYFLDDVKEMFKEKSHMLAKNTKIEIATLNEPGVIGAALLAKTKN
jgi:glucokinase